MRRILGLFAHPDDELFCAGGTIADRVDAGAEARIVSLTRGEAGRISHVDLATRSTLGAVRSGELAAAGAVLGAETRCLDFPDGGLEQVDRARLIEAAVDQILDFGPDTVIAFDDTGAYGHPDHVVAASIAVDACAAIARSDPGAAPQRVLQATFPQRDQLLLRLIVDWLSELKPRGAALDSRLGTERMTPGAADDACDLRMDVGHLVRRKFEALTQHRSQYRIEAGLFPEFMLHELLGVETFVEGWHSAATVDSLEVPS